MTNSEILIPIPGRLHSITDVAHVAGADEIYDDLLSKSQETLNGESAYIDADDGSSVIPSFDPETDTVWNKQQTLSAAQKAQVKTNLGITDANIGDGGTATGIMVALSNTSYTTAQVRNIILSTQEPTSADGNNGDIWIVYE